MTADRVLSESIADLLIVDDNLVNLKLLTEMLCDRRYKVRRAINAVIALKAIQTAPPDLILLDINLPDLSGYEMCARLKRDTATRHIPVIFISALNDVVDKVKAFEVGGVDYISKPFEIAEVLVRIESQLSIQRAHAQIQQLSSELEQRVKDRTAQLEALTTELEDRVQQRTAQLAAINRELEAFAGTLSHDLRTPLSIILSSSEILQVKYGQTLDAKACHHLERIGTVAHQMGHQIEQVLTLYQLGQTALQFVRVNLSEFAQSILENLTALEPERKTDLRVEAGLTAWGDAVLLHSVLENLLSNAWKYSSKRDRTCIQVGAQPSRHGARTFYVRDNGVGFDSTQAQELFQPFARLPSAQAFPGTGVGLASVHKIILRHGGNIWADSVPDQGTTFYFTLGGG